MSAMHMAKTEEGAAIWFALNSFEIWKILFSSTTSGQAHGTKYLHHP